MISMLPMKMMKPVAIALTSMLLYLYFSLYTNISFHMDFPEFPE